MIWYFHRCTCVMDLPALRTQRAICTVKFMQPLVMWQQRFDVGSYFLSLPAAFRPKCNQLICWWQWLPPRNFIKIRSVGLFMQSEKMPMLAQDRHPDIGTDIGTTGHSENIITYAATSLYYCRSYYDCFFYVQKWWIDFNSHVQWTPHIRRPAALLQEVRRQLPCRCVQLSDCLWTPRPASHKSLFSFSHLSNTLT